MGTLPAGTTEAQVNDQILVVEVAGEATPTPNRPRPDWGKSETLLYNIRVFGVSLSPWGETSPSTERCERLASLASDCKAARWWIVHHSISRDIPGAVSRPTLALVDELTRLLIVPSGVTGCGSLVLGDELTGATSSGSCPARTSICWPWSTCSANSKESSPRPSMRPTSWGSARTRRARTVVEALEAPALVPLFCYLSAP